MPHFETVTVLGEKMTLLNLTPGEKLERKAQAIEFDNKFWANPNFEKYKDDDGWIDYDELSDEEWARDVDCSIDDWNEITNGHKY